MLKFCVHISDMDMEIYLASKHHSKGIYLDLPKSYPTDHKCAVVVVFVPPARPAISHTPDIALKIFQGKWSLLPSLDSSSIVVPLSTSLPVTL